MNAEVDKKKKKKKNQVEPPSICVCLCVYLCVYLCQSEREEQRARASDHKPLPSFSFSLCTNHGFALVVGLTLISGKCNSCCRPVMTKLSKKGRTTANQTNPPHSLTHSLKQTFLFVCFVWLWQWRENGIGVGGCCCGSMRCHSVLFQRAQRKLCL